MLIGCWLRGAVVRPAVPLAKAAEHTSEDRLDTLHFTASLRLHTDGQYDGSAQSSHRHSLQVSPFQSVVASDRIHDAWRTTQSNAPQPRARYLKQQNHRCQFNLSHRLWLLCRYQSCENTSDRLFHRISDQRLIHENRPSQ
jgi:hypothetical protein